MAHHLIYISDRKLILLQEFVQEVLMLGLNVKHFLLVLRERPPVSLHDPLRLFFNLTLGPSVHLNPLVSAGLSQQIVDLGFSLLDALGAGLLFEGVNSQVVRFVAGVDRTI